MSAAVGATPAPSVTEAKPKAPVRLELIKVPVDVKDVPPVFTPASNRGPWTSGTLRYFHVFVDALRSPDDAVLDGFPTPTTNDEWLTFLSLAIAKEAKYLLTSSAMDRVRSYLTDYLTELPPETLAAYKKDGINAIKNRTTPWTRRGETREDHMASFVSDSLIVLKETHFALITGNPLVQEWFSLPHYPTTAFIYVTRDSGSGSSDKVRYVGHVFVQDAIGDPALFFVSIYKSMFADARGFAERVVQDVTDYAIKQKKTSVYTFAALGSMKDFLLKNGFEYVKSGERYVKDLTATATATNKKGGRRRTQKKHTKRKHL